MEYYEPGPHPSLDRDRARGSSERERDAHPIALKVRGQKRDLEA